MGIKLFNTHKDMLNNEWKIEVIDTSFSGTPTEFVCSAEGAVIEWDGENKNILTDGIRQSICTFGIDVQTSGGALDTYLQSIIEYTEQRLFCNVYLKVGGVWVVKWRGQVNQGGYEFPDMAPYWFTMTANDGLVRLKDNLFNFVLTSDPKIEFIEAIRQALFLTGTFDLYTPGDFYIGSTIDIIERSQRTTYGMLYDTRVNKETWFADVESQTPMTAFDVLEKICKSIGCQLKMWNGVWYFFRAVDLRKSTVTVNRYNTSITPLSNDTYAPNLSFPVTGSRYNVSEIQYTFEQPYKKVTVNKDTNSIYQKNKLLKFPYDLTASTFTINDVGIPGASYKFEAEISVAWSGLNIKRNTVQTVVGKIDIGTTQLVGARGEEGTDHFYACYFYIKCGRFYLKKINGNFWWVDNPADKSLRYDAKKDLTNPFLVNFDMAFLPTPVGETQIEVSLYKILYDNLVPSKFSSKLTLRQRLNQNEAGEVLYERKESVFTENEDITNIGLKFEHDIFLNDLDAAIANGNMEVYTGSAWIKSQRWKSGTTDPDPQPFLKLQAREIMRVYKKPLYKCTGEFFMNTSFDVLHTITWRSRVLFFNAGRFSTATNEYSGEFVQISYTSNNRPISATKPDLLSFESQVTEKLRDITQKIQGMNTNMNVLNESVANLQVVTQNITQTRSLNADKYLLDNVFGIPESGADVGSEYYLKAVVSADGITTKWNPS